MPSRLAGDERVLLVDDDDTVRRFFVRALTRAGFDPAVASGVFVTMVTDVVGFFAFLGLATLWLI